MASIEGERGMPTPKPPFPASSGLWGKPTIINNVETLGNVPAIIPTRRRPGSAPSGTRQEPGHQDLRPDRQGRQHRPDRGPVGRHAARDRLRHRRRHPGRQAVQGRADRRALGRLPHRGAPRPAAGLRLAASRSGAMVGSGGLVVHGRGQLHGRDGPLLHAVHPERVLRQVRPLPRGHQADAGPADRRSSTARPRWTTSTCWKSWPRSSRTPRCAAWARRRPTRCCRTLRYFRDEYVAHVRDQRCPAGQLQGVPGASSSTPTLCKGCGRCAKACPAGAITGEVKQPYVIDQDKCIRCGACVETCRFGAVEEK